MCDGEVSMSGHSGKSGRGRRGPEPVFAPTQMTDSQQDLSLREVIHLIVDEVPEFKLRYLYSYLRGLQGTKNTV